MNFSEQQLISIFPFSPSETPTLIDVGAHVGSSSIPFLRKGWRVIAFEPEPQNRAELEINLQPYNNFTIIPKAVSNQSGEKVPFYVSQEHWGIHSLKPYHQTHKPELTVETVRLDETLNALNINEVTFLKIDIEGADFLALQGFNFDQIKPEIVMCEFADDRSIPNFNYSHHDVAKYMQDKGYHVFISEWAEVKEYGRKGQATAPHQFLQCVEYPLDHQPAWGNLIFVKKDRVTDFQATLENYLTHLKRQEKFNQVLAESRQKLAPFRNKHKGERCVIIGNGPSLNKMDLSFLKNEITFGMNRIYLGFEKYDFTPTYYTSVNPLVLEQSAEQISKIPCPKFVSTKGIDFIENREDIIFINTYNYAEPFSQYPEYGLCEGYTVTYFALQLAYFMGFQTVILIGVDHNFLTKGTPNKEVISQGDDPNHFHPAYFGKGIKWHLPDLENSEKYYCLADAYYRVNNRLIIDATFEGHCQIFQKANYKDIFFSNSFTINFQALNLIIFPDWQQDEEELSLTLTEVLSAIASHPQAEEITLIIDTTNAENEEDAQLLVSGVTMNLMLEEGVELPETTEIAFISNLNSLQWEKLFAQMGNNQLYHLPFFIISQWENIPESALESYCKYLLQNCQIFLNNGDAEKYLDYYIRLLQNIVEKIEANPQSQLWQKITLIVAQNSYFIPCYFNDQNLKEIYVNRAKLLEVTLRIKGFQLEYKFLPREIKQEKIKIGILSAHYAIQTETFSTLPVYNHLDRDKFDITLFTIKISNHRLEKYCFAHGDRVIQLPSTLSEQVDIIRSHDLDILFIGTNITARSHSITYLALHRLARIQIIDPNSPVSSGFPSIDYYITSKLSEHLTTAQEHYTEELITLDIPPQCFDFGTEANLKTDQIITRENLGLKPDQIVFVSGANYFKIIPEVEETWIKILTKVTNSVLVLYPFNPNWSNNYPISLFQQRIFKTLQKYHIAEDRLIILEPVKNSLEIKERLKVCDIYLDSFPYSGMTSMIDPLSVYLPTLVFSEKTSRSQKAASILRYFDLEDLIAYSSEEYIEKAILLAQNSKLREEYREKIKEKMQSNPSFLDSKKYAQQIEKVFINLYEQYHHENTLREFNLTNINYLIFPDWQSDEETLTEELYNLISHLANNSFLSDSPLIKGGWGGSTLVIDRTAISEEDANLILSGIAMNLMMEEEIDLENTLDFTLINNLNDQQWNKLLPQITAKITLENENQEIINQVNIEDLVTIDGNGNNYAIFPDWKADQEELALEIGQVLMNLSEEENCTLLVNLNNADQEEVGLFFSEIAMNLMLRSGVELSDNLQINFVNFTPNQWASLGGLIKEKITIDSENLPDNLLTQ